MANQLLSPTSRRDQKSKCGQCMPLVSAVVGAYVAVGLMLAIGFGLYMLLLLSPELLNRLLQDVIKCEDFPGYLSPSSTAADNVEYCSDHKCMSSFSPPAAIPHSSVHNNTTITGLVETQQPEGEKKIRVLLGIFVMAWNIKQRHLLRMAYGVQASASKDADFTIWFIMGALDGGQAYYQTEVERDNATFGDIIVLTCKESINDGKTFSFFSSLPSLVVSGTFDYVMKLDDDSYIRLESLGKALEPLPRTDLYYGYSLPCGNEDPYRGYMAGAGYLVSWDLVQWIADSPISEEQEHRRGGYADARLVQRRCGMAKNRATSFGLFYDHPERAGDQNCAHELRLDTILIHKLKTVDQWLSVLVFFLTARSNSLP